MQLTEVSVILCARGGKYTQYDFNRNERSENNTQRSQWFCQTNKP